MEAGLHHLMLSHWTDEKWACMVPDPISSPKGSHSQPMARRSVTCFILDVVKITERALDRATSVLTLGRRRLHVCGVAFVDGSGGRKAKVVRVCCGGLGMVFVVAIWLLAGDV